MLLSIACALFSGLDLPCFLMQYGRSNFTFNHLTERRENFMHRPVLKFRFKISFEGSLSVQTLAGIS